MSDSFADLWASTAPAKSTDPPVPQKKPSSTQPRKQAYDAFSILSASQPSILRPVVGANTSKLQLHDQQARQPKPTAGTNGGDAFSTLFTSSLDGSAVGPSTRPNMTMAERAAFAQKTKAVTMKASNSAVSAMGQMGSVPASSSSLWDGLDSLAQPTTTSSRPTTQDSFNLAFDRVPETQNTSLHQNVSAEDDDWGLSEFTSRPSEPRSASAPAKQTSSSRSTSLWDLDEFGSPEPPSSHPQPRPPPSRSLTGTPGDFDFGDREDSLLGGADSDSEETFRIRQHGYREGDDILGDLGKPVSHSHSPSPNPPISIQSSALPPRTIASPPPHITGQLVEMGFSPVDARTALLNTMTDGGFDVQTAAELLLSQGGQDAFPPPSNRPPELERRREGDRERNMDRAPRRPPPTRIDSAIQPPSFSLNPGQSQSQLDITAEKLLSQASEIGRGVFSKANALWKEGKERAVKMYEERAATVNAASGASVSDGRPRWMRDQDSVSDECRGPDPPQGRRHAVRPEFRDDDHGKGEGLPVPAHRPQLSSLSQSQSPPPSISQPEREHDKEVDLFSSDSPSTTVYQSPYRRGKPRTQAPLPPASIQSSSSAPSTTALNTEPSTSRSRPSPSPPRTFTAIITHSAIASSLPHRLAGTDAYKRGDFPAALAAYVRALSALPLGNVLRVPILTNVALVRSKVGELREAVQACEEAIVIVDQFVGGESRMGTGSEFASESMSDVDVKTRAQMNVGTGKVNVSIQDDGSGAINGGDLPTSLDLVEGLCKAFRRRAEALEGLEKWEAARSTWDAMLSAEWAGTGVKGEAIKGVGRCRKMVDSSGGDGGGGMNDGPGRSMPPKPKPMPKPKLKSSSMIADPASSVAVAALRSTQDAQQNEDAARLACKDVVDARLSAWKSGREGNIRALLTSLDDNTVLWPGLGWRKVGMAEVVSKGQVKGAYVRVIAKVHPDKLNAQNTTVEQRMIANEVFGTLNEAWNVFQQQ